MIFTLCFLFSSPKRRKSVDGGAVKNAPRKKGHLIPHHNTAPIVVRIFELAVSGQSTRTIASQLNSDGAITPLKYLVEYHDEFSEEARRERRMRGITTPSNGYFATECISVISEDGSIALAKKYTSNTLESDESSAYWETEDGSAFLILEFDVECLNPSHKTVDGDAITDLVATTASGNTYGNREYQYITSELWLYIRNTYLDANLPEHIYVYTYIPASVMGDGVTVNMKLAGTNYEITI